MQFNAQAGYNPLEGSLGSGLLTGLNNLSQNKMKQMQASKTSELFQNVGYSPEDSHFLGNLQQQDPQQFDQILQQLGNNRSGQQNNAQSLPQESYDENEYKLPDKLTKEEIDRFKLTKDVRHDLIAQKRASDNKIRDLSSLAELSSSGKLDTPGYLAFLENAGLDIPALMSPESQEFKKIQQGLLKDVKQFVGGRVTNQEMEMFLQTIPTLSQSPEGRSRVLTNMKRLAQAEREYYNAFEEVLKKNKGIPPYDLEEQIERRADKKISALMDRFKKDIVKEAPPGQNKLVTALQAGAGKAVGRIPNALQTAGIGALGGAKFGKNFGVAGAGAGAALGGLAGGLYGLAGGGIPKVSIG